MNTPNENNQEPAKPCEFPNNSSQENKLYVNQINEEVNLPSFNDLNIQNNNNLAQTQYFDKPIDNNYDNNDDKFLNLSEFPSESQSNQMTNTSINNNNSALNNAFIDNPYSKKYYNNVTDSGFNNR